MNSCHFYFMLFASILLFSCSSIENSDEDDNNGSLYETKIIGTWSLEKSHIGQDHYPYGEETHRYEEYIVTFLKSGDTQEKINGTSSLGEYRIVGGDHLLWNDELYVIRTLDGTDLTIETTKELTNILGIPYTEMFFFKKRRHY